MRIKMAIKLCIMGMFAALQWLALTPVGLAQEAPKKPQSHAAAEVSDQDLRAFAKCYIEFHKIRAEYEPVLQGARTPADKSKIEREAVAKFGKAVEKQGLSLQSYAQIFQSVSANEELREKAMQLIAEERGKS